MNEVEFYKKERFLNLDLLRTFSMFLIVLLHSIDHSGVLEQAEIAENIFTFGYVFFVYFLCQICVNLFVLISGFFLSESQFKSEKLVRLWIETVFYSALLKCLFMATGKIPFSIVSLISCFVPVFTGRYWFVTIYFGMYLLMPFMNILIRKLDTKQFTELNVLLFFLFSVWVSFSAGIKGINSGAGWGLPWFIVLYFAGAWFRKCYKKEETGYQKFLFMWILITGTVVVNLVFGKRIQFLYAFAKNLYKYDSIPVYVSSLLVFAAFLHIHINDSKLIVLRTISSATFGVYLIHAHANVSPWLWYDLTKIAQYSLLSLFPIIHLGIVLIVFIVCLFLSCCGNRIVKIIYKRFMKIAVIPEKIARTMIDIIMNTMIHDINSSKNH